MRVLHVFRYFRPHFTGEGVFTERLVRELRAQHSDMVHDILVVTTPAPAEPLALPQFGRCIYLQAQEGASRLQQSLAMIRWMAAHAGHYDVIHVHSLGDRTWLAYLIARMKGARILMMATLDDSVAEILESYRPLLRPLVRALMRTVGRFVAISSRLDDGNASVPSARRTIIPIGIPLPPPAPAHPPARPVTLITVGGICARKNQWAFVQALALLKAATPDIMGLIVGPVMEPDYKADLDRFIDEQDLRGNVRFVGQVEDVYSQFQQADIMFFPSTKEGFGTVVIEAMICGLPVVARNLPGVNEAFILQGETGYRIESLEEAIVHLRALVADPALRQRLGQAGARLARAEYGLDVVANRYAALYRAMKNAKDEEGRRAGG